MEVKVDCYLDSGILKNAKIYSFIIRNDDDEYIVKNKNFTLYGEYYQGIEWENNFKELYCNTESKVYSVIDNNGKIYKLGDSILDYDNEMCKISEFYISNQEICFKGLKIINTFGRF